MQRKQWAYKNTQFTIMKEIEIKTKMRYDPTTALMANFVTNEKIMYLVKAVKTTNKQTSKKTRILYSPGCLHTQYVA